MDFSWFFTIPGMLISGGVLFLIGALIMFIATTGNKNKNKNEKNMSAQSAMGAQEMINNGVNTPVQQPEQNVTNVSDVNSISQSQEQVTNLNPTAQSNVQTEDLTGLENVQPIEVEQPQEIQMEVPQVM